MNKVYLVNKLVEEFQIFSKYDSAFKFVFDGMGDLNEFGRGWVLVDLIGYALLDNVQHSLTEVNCRYSPKAIEETFKLLEERYNGE